MSEKNLIPFFGQVNLALNFEQKSFFFLNNEYSNLYTNYILHIVIKIHYRKGNKIC